MLKEFVLCRGAKTTISADLGLMTTNRDQGSATAPAHTHTHLAFLDSSYVAQCKLLAIKNQTVRRLLFK